MRDSINYRHIYDITDKMCGSGLFSETEIENVEVALKLEQLYEYMLLDVIHAKCGSEPKFDRIFDMKRGVEQRNSLVKTLVDGENQSERKFL